MLALSFEEREYKSITDPVCHDFDLLGEECTVDASGVSGHERAVCWILCFNVFEYAMTFVSRFAVGQYEDR